MKTKWDIPIVTAGNISEVVAGLGIEPWDQIGQIIDLDAYTHGALTETQQNELRFAPRTEVVPLKTPNGKPFTGFRTTGKPWATTFVLLPGDLVLIVAEWKHGAFDISLSPPSGVVSVQDPSMVQTAQREFLEETGIRLQKTIPLHKEGISVSSRSNTQRYFPFLGIVPDSFDRSPAKLDDNEHLQLILFPLNEWLKLIENGGVIDDCAITTTFLSLTRLKRLQISAQV